VGGIFLMVAQPLSPGTSIELIFDVPSGEVRARGLVRHGRPGKGMGVQFVHMNSDERARLHRFIQHLEKEQRKQVPDAPSAWFNRDGQPLDSGEAKTHHELFVLLHQIYSTRLTGKLQLVCGRVERQLFFDAGQLVFATSSDRQDSLGEMMLRAGAISQNQFEEAAELVRTGQRFGSAIAEMCLFSVDEVVAWVQRQLTQITSSVLDYPACRYYFFGSLEKNVVPEIAIPVPLGKMLLDAVRRANDLPLDHLAAAADLWIDLSPDPMLRFQAVQLNDVERSVLTALSQPIAAKELLSKTGQPAAAAARSLYALLVLGTVLSVPKEVGERAQPAAATPAATPVVDAPTATLPPAAAAPPPPRPEPEIPSAEESRGKKEFEEEIRKLLEHAEKSTYYELLGVTANSPAAQIKENFHHLARKFHPDRHMGQSEWIALLQDLMGRLTIAYKTLVDDEKRAAYDKQIAAAGAFTLGQEKTEVQETVDDCLMQAKQCVRAQNFAGSILWLRKCVELEPFVAKYHAMLARSLSAIPQYRQEAVHHFSVAIEQDEWNTSTYFQFGELYELMQLPWRAVPLYRKILEIDPEHTKALERLAALEKKPEAAQEKSFVSRLFSRKSS
jgi:tetratricopeptide (TPR) repeat protein